jgi:RNA polymerase sigma factor (sigma-70 family)
MRKDSDRLVIDNLKLVHFVAQKFRGMVDYDDLVQEGTIGLIKAANRFDPSLGNKFPSFAVPYIRGEIQHFIRDKSNTIKHRRGEKPIPVLSLNCPLSGLDSDIEIGDTVASPAKMVDPELELIQDFIKTLPEKEKLLFNMRLNGADRKVIADKLNVSAITVTRHLDRLTELAREWVEAFNNNCQPIVIDPKIGVGVNCRSAKIVSTKILMPTQKTQWENLRIDIKIVFDLYLKSPSLRSIDRCIDALYKFGQVAIKRKYWHLNGSEALDNLVSWEDLLHESICKLRQFLIDRKLQSYEHAIAMLYVFAKHSYWNMLRQSTKYTSLNKPIASETDTTLEDFVASKIAAITPERSEDFEIIETALAKLPPLNKQIIELAWIEGKTVTQISQQMGVTIPFVSNIIQKSRIAIARSLIGRKMSLGY